MTIEVQPIRERDLANLRRISIETFGATFGPYNAEADLQQHYQRAYNVDQLRRELLNPESQFFFAKIDDEIAGYLKTNVGMHNLNRWERKFWKWNGFMYDRLFNAEA